MISSDDYSVYNGYPVKAQQKCLAHLRRHFKKLISVGTGNNPVLGQALLELIDEAFAQHRHWRQTQDVSPKQQVSFADIAYRTWAEGNNVESHPDHPTVDRSSWVPSRYLCNNAGMIFAEDLNLKAMSKGMLSKSTLDAAFGQFLNILQWVSWKRDVFFAKVNCNGTSQTCPMCDAHTPKDLSVRIHSCECGYFTDRDVAASQVVKKRGLILISAEGQSVLENVCKDGLTGAAMPSQESLKQKLALR